MVPALVVEALVWWGVALGIWLLTVSSVTGADLVLAGTCALPCGIAAVTFRRQVAGSWQLPRAALRWAPRLPLAVVVDTGRVLALPWLSLLRRPAEEGQLTRVPVAPGADPAATSRRTAAAWLLSMTPGSYAVYDDADTGELLVHSLVGGRYAMDEAVRR